MQSTINSSSISARVRAIVAEQFHLRAKDVKLENVLVVKFHADSLDMVELAMALEDAFEMEIPEAEGLQLSTVRDIVEYVAKARPWLAVWETAPVQFTERPVDSLSAAQLNWAIGVAIGAVIREYSPSEQTILRYSEDWAAGGPLVSSCGIGAEPQFAFGRVESWVCTVHGDVPSKSVRQGVGRDENQLRAAMLALADQFYGGSLEVPVSLLAR